IYLFFFFFYSYIDHRALHSFPTRRSSDLRDQRTRVAGLVWYSYTPARMFSQLMLRSRSRSSKTRTNYRWFWKNRRRAATITSIRSEEHTSELQSRSDLVCRLLLEKKKKKT